jgi:hypothetical protein
MAAPYTVHGDESVDGTSSRVFAVAGIFGTQHEWDDLSARWFRATGGVDFHAAECESDLGDFQKNVHAENQRVYRHLTNLLCSTKLLGRAMVIDLQAHKKYFPNAVQGDPYYLCFAHVLLDCAQLGYLSFPQGEVEFTFDRNLDKQYNATELYRYMSNTPEWRFHPYLSGKVGFASRKARAGIQAADLFARESMKYLEDQIGPVKREMRASAQALRKTRRFAIAVMDEESLSALAGRCDELVKTLKGAKESDYRRWLEENRIQDNTTRRILYLAEIDRLNLKR